MCELCCSKVDFRKLETLLVIRIDEVDGVSFVIVFLKIRSNSE